MYSYFHIQEGEQKKRGTEKMPALSAESVSAVVERLATKAREYDIEYDGFFSNHAAWMIVPNVRCGVSEEVVCERLAWYSTKLHPAAVVSAVRAFSSAELDAAVNGENRNFSAMRAFYDAEIAAETARQGGNTAAALDVIVSQHLPRAARGCIGAALHAILELGVGVEGASSILTANGLAYVTTRSWREHDVHKTEYAPEANLLTPLRAWCEDVLKESGKAELRHAWDTIGHIPWPIGAFQQRMLRCLQSLTTLTQHSVVLPASAPTCDVAGLPKHYGLDDAFLLAAVAVKQSNNEFFVVHGLTSLWAVRQVLLNVPSLSHEARCEMVGSWTRGFFCAFAAEALPGAANLLPCFSLIESHDVAALVSQYGRDPAAEGPETWDAVVRVAAEQYWKEEHILKAIWMLRETARELPAAVEAVLFATAYHLAHFVAEDFGVNARAHPEENTLRFAKVEI